jgi:diketogulonate reductase-like aldo/keto reductase
MVPHLEELLKTAKVKPAVNQIEFNPYLPQTEVVEFCKKNGIVVAAYTPLGPVTHFKEGPLDPVLAEIAAAHKMTPEQILLKWTSQ